MMYGKDKEDLKGEIGDAELRAVLRNFKASAHAWSEAAYSRPRTLESVRQRSWKLVAGWALGCVLVAGTVTGGMHERQVRQERASAAAAEQAQQRQLAAQRAQASGRLDDSDLMATVDRDVSRAVPSAMEPLARLMDEGESQ